MRIGKNAQLAVKWSNGEFTHYKVSKYRKWESIVAYFRGCSKNFRFAILYEYDMKNDVRGVQIGYFDRHRDTFN